MIPFLHYDGYYKTGTTVKDFQDFGIGGLSDAISCKVTEEINGQFELELQYPVNGRLADYLAPERIIAVMPSPFDTKRQPFRIYSIEKTTDGKIIVFARHISYDLSRKLLKPISATSLSGYLAQINRTNVVGDMPFTFSTSRQVSGNIGFTYPVSVRQALGGIEGSVLDRFKGEYVFDCFDVSNVVRRGMQKDIIVMKGKNIARETKAIDSSNIVSGCVAYWRDDTTQVVGDLIENTSATIESIYALDVTSEFLEKPTVAQLNTRATTYVATHSASPQWVSEIDFVPDNLEYSDDLRSLERCVLGDSLYALDELTSQKESVRIVKTVTDVIAERYETVQFGNVSSGVEDIIATEQLDTDRIEQLLAQLQVGKVSKSGDKMTGRLDAPNFRTIGDGYSSYSFYKENGKPAIGMIGNGASHRLQFEEFSTNDSGFGDRYVLPYAPTAATADTYYDIYTSKDKSGVRTSLGLNNLANVVIETGYITATSAGAQVTFSKTFPSAPRIVLTGSADTRTWVSARAATGFKAHANTNTRVDWIAVYVP